MKDIFDAKIFCKNCDSEMFPVSVVKKGFRLRAVRCEKCGDKIVHPGDLSKMEEYNGLKRKTFNVKLRMVGNSHAISIPKEVVNFMNGDQRRMRRHMDDMVKLCFEDFGKLSLDFFGDRIRPKPRKREFSVSKKGGHSEW